MRILLIKPAEEYTGLEPLGLMYLAAYLRQYANCETKILDLSVKTECQIHSPGDPPEETLCNELDNFAPDLVGISSMYSLYAEGLHNTARIVKRIKKTLPVIAGGAHVSACPEWVLKDENIDAAILGEGEGPLLEIVNSLKEKKDISRISNVLTKRGGEIITNAACSFIKDIDTIPSPTWDLVDMDRYLRSGFNIEHALHLPRAAIVSSRGCPYDCVYCSIHSVWQHTYRGRSPENVVDEIERLIRDYGVREIAFWDDNLTFNKERTMGICDEIIRRKINIKWCTPNGVAITTLDKETIIRMKQSGCYKLTFGIDTGSARTQKFMKKGYINLKEAKQTIRFCNKIGLWTVATFVIGFPYETEEDIRQTINYATGCGANMAFFYIACPYPGSELYNIYRKEGLLLDSGDEKTFNWKSSPTEPGYSTKNFTPGQLKKYRNLAYRKMYIRTAFSFLNPMTISRKLLRPEGIKYFVKMSAAYSRRLLNNLRGRGF